MKGKLREDLKQAMKAKDQLRMDVIRGVLTDIKYKEVALIKELEEGEIISVIRGGVKKRQEAIALYLQGNRPELAEKERKEMAILESYLPQEMSLPEIEKAVETLMAELGATNRKEMGKVMKPLMERYRGKIDGKLAQQVLMQKLGS